MRAIGKSVAKKLSRFRKDWERQEALTDFGRGRGILLLGPLLRSLKVEYVDGATWRGRVVLGAATKSAEKSRLCSTAGEFRPAVWAGVRPKTGLAEPFAMGGRENPPASVMA